MSGKHYDPSILLKCECSDANWQKLQELVADWAKTHEGETADPRPTLMTYVVDKAGGFQLVHNAIFTPFNTDAEKEATLRTIALKHVEMELVPMAVAFTSAAWVSNKRGMQPKDDPERKESIIIGMARLRTFPVSRESLLWIYPVTRDAEGKAHLGELNKPQGGVPVILDRFYRLYFEALSRRFGL